MNTLAEKVIKHKRLILILFIMAILVSSVLSKMVSVNYDLISYLPADAHSTKSIEVMNEEFSKAPPNARILVENVSVPEALEIKNKISNIDGVVEISWLDDIQNLHQPLEAIPSKVLQSFYIDGDALFAVVIDDEKAIDAVLTIKGLVANKGEITGDIVDTVIAKQNTGSETSTMLMFILPIILTILLLTTSSWFEPVLFLIAIGVAIVINNGTNAFLGEISFITKTTSAILQLAVSMDYSIFLLHRFSEFRAEGKDVKTAMINAMKKSFSSIFASGLTTAIGFGALIIMRFKIGPDLGIVLAKGILFSMLSIMILLPVITVYTYKIIDKTHHRSFLPSFNGFGKFAVKLGVPVMILVAVLIVPSFLAQQQNDFMYGASVMGATSAEITKTEQLFGKANNMVLLVPKGDVVKEKALGNAFLDKSYVSSVVSYTQSIGAVIPQEYVPSEKLSDLQSNNYSRMILTLLTEQESAEAFRAVEEIRSLSQLYYPDNYYLAGGTANVHDMKTTVVSDNALVTLIAIIGIGLVLLFTFKSLTLPIVLLFTIETSIWVNLAFPYFSDEKMAYLGFMIISAIQLGATVDYAILFANRYIENRSEMSKKKAAIQTVSDTATSILTSASILTIAGFIMGFISTNSVIGQLGTLIGRGTLLSASMVFFFLPSALMLLDKPIQKTTFKLNFYKGE